MVSVPALHTHHASLFYRLQPYVTGVHSEKTIVSLLVVYQTALILLRRLARHTPEKVMPILHTVIKQAREEHADAVSHGDGIFAVGYCFGGKYVLSLAASRPDTETAGREAKAEEGQIRKGPEIKCGVCAHGTLVGLDDVKDLKAPVQIVAVEDDPLFPDEVLEAARQSLKQSGTDHEVEVYPGVPHGMSCGCFM